MRQGSDLPLKLYPISSHIKRTESLIKQNEKPQAYAEKRAVQILRERKSGGVFGENDKIKVQELPWKKEDGVLRAKSDLGWYEIWFYKTSQKYRFTLHTFDDEIEGNFVKTEEEAKENAQTHFKERLLQNII